MAVSYEASTEMRSRDCGNLEVSGGGGGRWKF